MRFDENRLHGLIEESQDTHSQAMRLTDEALAETVEHGREARAAGHLEFDDRRRFLRKALFAAGAVGGGFGATFLRGAFTHVLAASGDDVAALQTSAALENLAVKVYQTAAGLPPSVSGAANPVILKFVQTTIAQHTDHAKAFNAAAAALGGQEQTNVDSAVYNAVVTPALPKITGPADVLALAITLEDAAAQTYISFGGAGSDANAIKTWASVAPVEAQHVAILRAVKALVDGGAPQLIALPPDLTKLPSAAGSVGFPKSFYETSAARPATEAAVK